MQGILTVNKTWSLPSKSLHFSSLKCISGIQITAVIAPLSMSPFFQCDNKTQHNYQPIIKQNVTAERSLWYHSSRSHFTEKKLKEWHLHRELVFWFQVWCFPIIRLLTKQCSDLLCKYQHSNPGSIPVQLIPAREDLVIYTLLSIHLLCPILFFVMNQRDQNYPSADLWDSFTPSGFKIARTTCPGPPATTLLPHPSIFCSSPELRSHLYKPYTSGFKWICFLHPWSSISQQCATDQKGTQV